MPECIGRYSFQQLFEIVFQYFLQYLMPECIGRYSFQQLFEVRVSMFSAIFDARVYW